MSDDVSMKKWRQIGKYKRQGLVNVQVYFNNATSYIQAVVFGWKLYGTLTKPIPWVDRRDVWISVRFCEHCGMENHQSNQCLHWKLSKKCCFCRYCKGGCTVLKFCKWQEVYMTKIRITRMGIVKNIHRLIKESDNIDENQENHVKELNCPENVNAGVPSHYSYLDRKTKKAVRNVVQLDRMYLRERNRRLAGIKDETRIDLACATENESGQVVTNSSSVLKEHPPRISDESILQSEHAEEKKTFIPVNDDEKLLCKMDKCYLDVRKLRLKKDRRNNLSVGIAMEEYLVEWRCCFAFSIKPKIRHVVRSTEYDARQRIHMTINIFEIKGQCIQEVPVIKWKIFEAKIVETIIARFGSDKELV